MLSHEQIMKKYDMHATVVHTYNYCDYMCPSLGDSADRNHPDGDVDDDDDFREDAHCFVAIHGSDTDGYTVCFMINNRYIEDSPTVYPTRTLALEEAERIYTRRLDPVYIRSIREWSLHKLVEDYKTRMNPDELSPQSRLKYEETVREMEDSLDMLRHQL